MVRPLKISVHDTMMSHSFKLSPLTNSAFCIPNIRNLTMTNRKKFALMEPALSWGDDEEETIHK